MGFSSPKDTERENKSEMKRRACFLNLVLTLRHKKWFAFAFFNPYDDQNVGFWATANFIRTLFCLQVVRLCVNVELEVGQQQHQHSKMKPTKSIFQ